MASNKAEPNVTTLKEELGIKEELDVTQSMDTDNYPGLSTTPSNVFNNFNTRWDELRPAYEKTPRVGYANKEFDYIFLVYLVGYVNIFVCNINNILSQMRLAIEGNTAIEACNTTIKQLERRLLD